MCESFAQDILCEYAYFLGQLGNRLTLTLIPTNKIANIKPAILIYLGNSNKPPKINNITAMTIKIFAKRISCLFFILLYSSPTS